MAENTRVIREQKQLERNMNVPLVDDNLHVCALRGRNIPYDTKQRWLNRQSNRGKQKPGIHPRQNSLQTNYKLMLSKYKPNHKWVGKCPYKHHLDKYHLNHWWWDLIE